MTIEIFNPIPSKGFNKKVHTFNPKGIEDEEDYVELGLLVRDDQGEFLKDKVVTITAGDATQNKTLNGTGAYRKIFDRGMKKSVPFYPFHYEYSRPGKHTITFTCEGITQSIDLIVTPKKPKNN